MFGGWLHDIEQEQIVTATQSASEPAPAVVHNLQVHAPAGEEALHQLAELDVIIDQQDRDPCLGRDSPGILILAGCHDRDPPGEARASNHLGRGVILGFILPDALPGHRVDSPIKAAHWGSSAPG
jgi:hypothetical protein